MSKSQLNINSPAGEKLLQDVIALQPQFREMAGVTKEDRKVAQANIDALQEIGFFLALQPRAYGGLEISPQEFFRCHLAIAEACMSTAWVAGIIAVHSFQIALMDKQAQEDVWGEDIHTRTSSSYAPVGKVEVVDGGFKLSGRWGWSSGSDHCTWALLGAIVPGEGYRTFLVPKGDYEILDTWHPMGLVDIPWAQIFVRVVCTPAIGACKDALRLYKETAQKKVSMDPSKHSTDPSTLERISAAENTTDEMEAILMRNFDNMVAAVNAGEQVSVQERAKYRYQASLVIEKSMEVIDSLFSMAGGSSVLAGSELQQRFLDVHTARAHVANNPTNFARNLGSLHLGLDNQDFFI